MFLATAEVNVKQVKESEVNSLVTTIHFDTKNYSFKKKISFLCLLRQLSHSFWVMPFDKCYSEGKNCLGEVGKEEDTQIEFQERWII